MVTLEIPRGYAVLGGWSESHGCSDGTSALTHYYHVSTPSGLRCFTIGSCPSGEGPDYFLQRQLSWAARSGMDSGLPIETPRIDPHWSAWFAARFPAPSGSPPAEMSILETL